jgi:hypothetical protein
MGEAPTLTICIERLASGQFRVYKEPEAMATADGLPSSGAGEPDGDEAQGGEAVLTADDLEGALRLVMDLVDQHPDEQSPGAQFSAGFQSEKAEGY